ncbi:hypothetical protein TI04_02210 [Achromatium sp. WMS2]|nr:hypothetical protein TI04_02210 [Achromatium sp. WMS2]
MANITQTMKNVRSKLREILGNQIVEESFFTCDHDTKQIVSNKKIGSYHFIFDLYGNLIKKHKD